MTRLDHQNLPPLNLTMLLSGVVKLLSCPLPTTTAQFVEGDLLQSIRETKLKLPTNLVGTMAEYFQLDDEDFRQIHKFLWDAGSEWNDVCN